MLVQCEMWWYLGLLTSRNCCCFGGHKGRSEVSVESTIFSSGFITIHTEAVLKDTLGLYFYGYILLTAWPKLFYCSTPSATLIGSSGCLFYVGYEQANWFRKLLNLLVVFSVLKVCVHFTRIHTDITFYKC